MKEWQINEIISINKDNFTFDNISFRRKNIIQKEKNSLGERIIVYGLKGIVSLINFFDVNFLFERSYLSKSPVILDLLIWNSQLTIPFNFFYPIWNILLFKGIKYIWNTFKKKCHGRHLCILAISCFLEHAFFQIDFEVEI